MGLQHAIDVDSAHNLVQGCLSQQATEDGAPFLQDDMVAKALARILKRRYHLSLTALFQSCFLSNTGLAPRIKRGVM